MPTISVPGGQLFYSVSGSGEPLVILRGLARSIRYWLGYEKILAKHYKVIMVENRGIGRSDAELPWDATIYDLADDVIRVLDHIKIKQAHILGVSLGGMISLATGIRYPERCKSLVVINSSIARARSLRLTVPAVYAMLRHARNNERMAEALGELLVGPEFPADKRQAMVEEWKQIEREESVSRVTSIKQILAALRFNARADLRKLTVPTLVVYGSGDLLVPAMNSMKIHHLVPNAELKKIDGGGHELMTDKPQELLEATLAFTKKQSAKASKTAPVVSLVDRKKATSQAD